MHDSNVYLAVSIHFVVSFNELNLMVRSELSSRGHVKLQVVYLGKVVSGLVGAAVIFIYMDKIMHLMLFASLASMQRR